MRLELNGRRVRGHIAFYQDPCKGTHCGRRRSDAESSPRRKQLVPPIPHKVSIKFFDQTPMSRVTWPEKGYVYELASGETRQYALACAPGTKICYDAWVSGHPKQWGTIAASKSK
jgi:hypothetical protein